MPICVTENVMTHMLPGSRPQQTREKTEGLLSAAGVSLLKPALVGVRGYYPDSMGEPGTNDRGIYDDAIFLVTPEVFASYNFNTDPSRERKGHGFNESTQGMAMLATGLYYFTRGLHRNTYMALRQSGTFRVIRDGNPPYEDIDDDFGINIHRGGESTTSSLGCQTVPPAQWAEFFGLVSKQMNRFEQLRIPYLLTENRG